MELYGRPSRLFFDESTGWEQIAQQYSRKSITYDSDRLMALAGLVK
jgi:hypothetical protein